jgi:hypothetical protein
MNIEDLNIKKDIVIDLAEAEKILSSITINLNQTGIVWLSHLRCGLGYIRDSITALNHDILKQARKEDGTTNRNN